MRVDRSTRGNTDSKAKSALLQIVRVRFRAFETKFGRPPQPDEPIFFADSETDPVKASITEARVQLEHGAREMGVELDPVLGFLGLSTGKAQSCRRPVAEESLRKGGHSVRARPLSRRQSDTASGWNRFLANERLHRRHRITREELQVLAGTAFLGEASTERDCLLVLEMIRGRKKV